MKRYIYSAAHQHLLADLRNLQLADIKGAKLWTISRDVHYWRRRLLAAFLLRRLRLARNPANRHRNPSDLDRAVPILVRPTSPVTGRIPICWRPPPPITAPFLICAFPSPTLLCGWNPVAGPVRSPRANSVFPRTSQVSTCA